MHLAGQEINVRSQAIYRGALEWPFEATPKLKIEYKSTDEVAKIS